MLLKIFHLEGELFLAVCSVHNHSHRNLGFIQVNFEKNTLTDGGRHDEKYCRFSEGHEGVLSRIKSSQYDCISLAVKILQSQQQFMGLTIKII